MLSAKQKKLDSKKIILYIVLAIILVGGTIYMYVTEKMRQSTVVLEGYGGPATDPSAVAPTGDQSQDASTSPAEILNIEVGLYKKIVSDPKFENLRDIYKDNGKEYKKGRKNPFLP